MCFFATIYIKRFISSTFIGCKVTKFPSNNSHIIHKKVYSDNLFVYYLAFYSVSLDALKHFF